MQKLTKQNQIEGFLDRLTDDEHMLIWAGYNALYYDFDAMLEVAVNNPKFEKDIPSLRRLADFEKKFKVRLYELLDIPGAIYEGHTRPICESVLLPVGETDNGEAIDVSLGPREQFCLHIRDSMYAGSWMRMKNDDNGSADKYLSVINNLDKYERKHRVNLGVLMREWVPLEPENKIKNNEDVKSEREGR